jgi:putative tricarboxylic transport membrane protein
MNSDALQGFAQAILPTSLLATAVGSLLGIVVGMIPGMTISTGIIILLPLTFVMDPASSIALLLGLYVGGMMGGSFAAILLNIPGTPSASATGLDGYPMAARGEAGRALGIAITASFVGGMFSFFCLFFIAPILADFALNFRTEDEFSLLLFGLTVICTFATRSLVKGLISAVIGLMIATVGQDPVMGTSRYTFGYVDMSAGIHFLTALIGLFAIPQLITNLSQPDQHTKTVSIAAGFRNVLPSLADLKRIFMPVSVGSATGVFLGILPGAGGPIAAFLSYEYARKVSHEPENFGKGAAEGIAAPESANSAVTGGALIPMMTLGIPGDPVTAILIGALIIHGLAPGPLLFLERGDFGYGIIFSFFWANIFNLIIAFASLRLLVRLLVLPKTLLMPTVAVLCVIGSYSLRNNMFDVYVMLSFGVLGITMRWLDIPVVPLLLALVLGGRLEEQLRVALTASKGDASIFFTSTYSAIFLALTALAVVWSLVSTYRQHVNRTAPAD